MVLTLEQVNKQGLPHKIYKSGNYSYKFVYMAYIKDGVDLLDGKFAIYMHEYRDGFYSYATVGKKIYLIKDGVKLLNGLKETQVWGYENGDYAYKSNGIMHYIINGVDIFDGLNVVWFKIQYNGDNNYQTKDGFYHLIRYGIDLLEGKEAVNCFLCKNGCYKIRTKDGKRYFITNK